MAADMTSEAKNKKNLSEEDIDQSVTAQANDDSAWGKPVRVRRSRRTSLLLPAKRITAARP